MASPVPITPPDPQREYWLHERYRAGQLAQILKLAGTEKMTGQVTLNLAQGTVVGLEVRVRIKQNLTF